MSDLTKEQYEQLPEFIKADYVEVEGVWRHGGFLKVKGTADQLDKAAKTAQAERERAERELSEYRKMEAERLTEAERKAYEKAKADGNTEELEKRWQEKLLDIQRRADESQKQFKERMSALAKKQKEAIADQIVAKYAVEGGEAAFKRLLLGYIDVDVETDSETFLDDSGSATSLDRTNFEGELKKNPLFARLIKADVATSGGGGANGSTVGGANKKPEDYSEQERVQLFKTNPVLFKKLFS